jgi:hypothetical protein
MKNPISYHSQPYGIDCGSCIGTLGSGRCLSPRVSEVEWYWVKLGFGRKLLRVCLTTKRDQWSI